jgi:hypothetical protein
MMSDILTNYWIFPCIKTKWVDLQLSKYVIKSFIKPKIGDIILFFCTTGKHMGIVGYMKVTEYKKSASKFYIKGDVKYVLPIITLTSIIEKLQSKEIGYVTELSFYIEYGYKQNNLIKIPIDKAVQINELLIKNSVSTIMTKTIGQIPIMIIPKFKVFEWNLNTMKGFFDILKTNVDVINNGDRELFSVKKKTKYELIEVEKDDEIFCEYKKMLECYYALKSYNPSEQLVIKVFLNKISKHVHENSLLVVWNIII